jgi:hypothetical protein
MVSVVVFEFE